MPEWAIHWEVERELSRCADEVPREQRSFALFPESAFADPDLTPGAADSYFLDRADQYLLPGDADRLVELARRWPAGERTAVALAAARQRPAEALDILAEALAALAERGDGIDRMRVAAEMVVLAGEGGFDPAIRAFFDERTGSYGVREQFLGDVLARRPRAFAALAGRLVRDERFDRLGPRSTRALIEFAEARLGRAIVPAAERNAANGVDEGERKGPFEPLPRWRTALRASVDEWAGPAPADAN